MPHEAQVGSTAFLGASHGQDTCPRCRARNIEGICAFDRHRSTSFYVKYENEKSISYGKFHASAPPFARAGMPAQKAPDSGKPRGLG